MEKLLVIAPQYVGDSILAIPFLRELKKHCGRADIDVISKNAGGLVFSKCSYVNEVFNIKNLDYKLLRQNNYGKVYVLKRSLSAALLAFGLGIKERIGFGGQFRELFLTNVVDYNKNDSKHELEYFMDVLRADYVEINDEKLEYSVTDSALKNIEPYLTQKPKALVVACSSTHVKDWTVENFAKTVDFLATKGYEIYFTGLDREKDYYEQITDFSKGSEPINLCGELSFDEVMALISKMDLVFGIDSGFCHAGAAFGKKVVSLFGSTSVSHWRPLGKNSFVISSGLPCAPCAKPKKCKDNYACLREMPAGFVISELEKLL